MRKNLLRNRQTLFANAPIAGEAEKPTTKLPKDPALKPARITRRQLEDVIDLLERIVAGGDATIAIDSADMLPPLRRAVAATPLGQQQGRAWFQVTWPSGVAERHHGHAATAKRLGYATQTVANAVSKGKGKAAFPYRDEHGNPAVVLVEKMLADHFPEA